MFGLGAGEILLIAVFALIFIGPKKLPELAKNLGRSLREFQKAKDELLHQVHTNDSSDKEIKDSKDSKEEVTADKVEQNIAATDATAKIDSEIEKTKVEEKES